MLNPELQKQISEEISKAPKPIQKFLTGTYFRETMELISRVNQLSVEQSEGVELEVILHILKLNDYTKLREALEKECKINESKKLDQLDLDLHRYVFSVLEKDQIEQSVESLEIIPEETNKGTDQTSIQSNNEVVNSNPVRININQANVDQAKSNVTLRETIKNSYGNTSSPINLDKLNEYDAKREAAAKRIEETIAQINLEESLNKQVAEQKPAIEQSISQKPLNNKAISTSNSAPTLKKPETIHDPYRELIEEEDVK
jgi:hypothetical protein